ncbi:SLC13 family permease [Alkalilimnicola sp. S0819]|nr:SLC13 family permease [Alkalilimnicola sp. S0819]MPQ15146.1 SLC13 family permease [Alkalilimnicola sp. S0819]
MALTRIGVELILMAGLTVLLTVGIVTPAQAFAGFANEGLLTVAVLYIVAAGMHETGATLWWVRRSFGRPRTVTGAQATMMSQVALLSGFLNNTPVVATFLPAVRDWARQRGFAVSRLLMPMSFAAILGGGLSLLGSSTNLIVAGLLGRDFPQVSLGLFEIAWLGVPLALFGVVFTLLFSRWLLPRREGAEQSFANTREYMAEMLVDAGGPLVGRTVKEAGLRNLPGLFLVEIERSGHRLGAVGPDEVLCGEDRLIFAGLADSIVDLYRIEGLRRPGKASALEGGRGQPHCLIEAVVARSAPFVGRSIRESRFRSEYGAAVVAVARHGERIKSKVGDIVLQPADTLLLETDQGFLKKHRQSRDFLLASTVENSNLPRDHKRVWAWLSLLLLIGLGAGGVVSLLNAALLAAGLMVMSGCLTARAARNSIDLPVVISIGAAFGLGEALRAAGAVEMAVQGLQALELGSPMLVLAAVYVLTSLLTLFITNNAAAILVLPAALGMAQAAGVAPTAMAVAVMFAANLSFATPTGYQTNLMVYGLGGYRFGDYVRFGLPLQAGAGVLALVLIPRIWG